MMRDARRAVTRPAGSSRPRRSHLKRATRCAAGLCHRVRRRTSSSRNFPSPLNDTHYMLAAGPPLIESDWKYTSFCTRVHAFPGQFTAADVVGRVCVCAIKVSQNYVYFVRHAGRHTHTHRPDMCAQARQSNRSRNTSVVRVCRLQL